MNSEQVLEGSSLPSFGAAEPAGAGTTSAVGEWRRGWPAVIGSMLGTSAGVAMFTTVSGFFVKPLSTAFGWSRGQIAVMSVAYVLTSLLLPLAGVIVDRRGVRTLVALGALAFAGCYAALGLMTGAYWMYLAVVGVIGSFAGPATAPFVFARPVVAAFDRSRGLALGMTMSGVPLLSFAILPIIENVIATHGWRAGFWTMAPVSLVLGALSVFLLGRVSQPASSTRGSIAALQPTRPGGIGLSFREALSDARFWLLALAMVAANFSLGTYLTSLQPMLSDKGVDGQVAAWLGVWSGVVIVAGRLASGTLLDRVWPPLVGCLSLAAPTFGLLIFVFAGSQTGTLALGICLIAIATGAELDILAFFASRYFGLRAFGAVFGVLGAMLGVSIAVGGIVSGYMFDRFGSYDQVLLAGAALSAVAAAAILASGLIRGSAAVR
jgi:MFS family permease